MCNSAEQLDYKNEPSLSGSPLLFHFAHICMLALSRRLGLLHTLPFFRLDQDLLICRYSLFPLLSSLCYSQLTLRYFSSWSPNFHLKICFYTSFHLLKATFPFAINDYRFNTCFKIFINSVSGSYQGQFHAFFLRMDAIPFRLLLAVSGP